MSEEVGGAMQAIRRFMFENVYTNPAAKSEEGKAEELIERLYEYYYNNPDKLPKQFRDLMNRGERLERVTCDYVACMSDRYAIDVFNSLFVPKSWEF
jgi:dGTPase